MSRLVVAALLISLFLTKATNGEIIHLHAKRGDLDGVLGELDKGVPLELRSRTMTSEPGVTPLFVAAKFGKAAVVRELLARGADPSIFFTVPNAQYTIGTALHHAAGYGHLEVVDLLIGAGADPNSYHPYIGTPLHQALQGGNRDVADRLVAAGAQQRVERPSVAESIANADLEHGRHLAKGCEICHGAPSKSRPAGEHAPNLWGIFERKAALDPDFGYSDFLRVSGVVWDADTLNSYLASPYQFVPGTSKGMFGIEDDDDRKALIAFLATLTE